MNCPNCGNQYEGNPAFCPGCGVPLQQQQQAYQQPNYQQTNYQQGYQQPGSEVFQGGYRTPVPNRNIGVCILLTIVTCGIYGIYWMISMADDLNAASDRQGDTSGGMVFLLSLVTCGIYTFYWMYKAGEKVGYIKQRNGEAGDSNDGILYLLLHLFGLGIVSYCLIQNELNKVATA